MHPELDPTTPSGGRPYEPPRVEDLGSLSALTQNRKTENNTDGGTADLNTRSA